MRNESSSAGTLRGGMGVTSAKAKLRAAQLELEGVKIACAGCYECTDSVVRAMASIQEVARAL